MIESGITIELPAVAGDVDADGDRRSIWRRSSISPRRPSWSPRCADRRRDRRVDQWRGDGSLAARLAAARPPSASPGIDEIRAGLQPADRVACTDELGCLMLVGRIDAGWRSTTTFASASWCGAATDRPSASTPACPRCFVPPICSRPNADGTLPDRVVIVDIFKEYPIGNSRSWLPKRHRGGRLQVTPLLETPQMRVLQVSPPERVRPTTCEPP